MAHARDSYTKCQVLGKRRLFFGENQIEYKCLKKGDFMKTSQYVATGLCVLGLSMFIGCDKKPKLDNDMSRASYAIGQQIGNNLKGQNLELDKDAVAISVMDVLSGKPARMKPEEVQQALQKLQEMINKKQGESAEVNKKKGAEFLEANKALPGVKTTASGLQIKILTEGTGKTPTAADVVKAHYKGALIDGKVFDSSYDRGQPAEFPLGQVIKGWTEALTTMKVGTKAQLFIPSELAYGPTDRPGIPGNSVLVFDVELLDVMAPKAEEKKKK
jgi:FKBP-type peptidyl-prolyl cis-trans isomerase FkpA